MLTFRFPFIRYAILTPETYPYWRGDPRQGITHIMNSVQMEDDQWQLGKTKVFIKNPESVSCLELITVLKKTLQYSNNQQSFIQVSDIIVNFSIG